MAAACRVEPEPVSDAARRAALAVERYAPVSVSGAAAGFARGVVTLAGPGTPARAKALLFAAGRLACFGERVGLELSGGVLLSEAVIERFVLTGCGGVSPATVRTLRTNLRALARATWRYPPPAPTPLARERAQAPYAQAEIDGFLRLAGAQSTPARRLRASALVCLGAGAGVIADELRHVRGSDVVCRSGGVIVVVGGSRARSVPVLERYHAPLLRAARFAGERYAIGGRDPDRRNVTDTLSALLCTDAGLPRLQAGRLRSTWLVECAQTIGLGAFMHAAGITCSQRLGDLAAELPAVSEEQLIALLGGSRG
jgi:integrase